MDKSATYSFMNRFYRYNRIKMVKDKEKFTLITYRGTFCNKVMSFELKNTMAIY